MPLVGLNKAERPALTHQIPIPHPPDRCPAISCADQRVFIFPPQDKIIRTIGEVQLFFAEEIFHNFGVDNNLASFCDRDAAVLQDAGVIFAAATFIFRDGLRHDGFGCVINHMRDGGCTFEIIIGAVNDLNAPTAGEIIYGEISILGDGVKACRIWSKMNPFMRRPSGLALAFVRSS